MQKKEKKRRNYDNVRNCFIPYCSVVVVVVVVVSVVDVVVSVVVSVVDVENFLVLPRIFFAFFNRIVPFLNKCNNDIIFND